MIELEDPTTRKRIWSVPGGKVEADETVEAAAIRETVEETGYRVNLTSAVFTSQYQFHWNADVYLCTTHWFLAELASPEPELVDDADYLLRTKWLDWPRCKPLFDNRPAFNAAIAHFFP